MEMDCKRVTYHNIDEILGCWEHRYLSCGYKRVYHNVHDIYINPTLNTLIALADVSYPENWFRKDNQRLEPHLSTLDALLIALYANILYISQIYQLDSHQRNRIWIKGVEIKAGSHPYNDLENIEVFSRFLKTSNNLWMRRIAYQCKLPVYHTSQCRQTVKLKQTRILTINQRRWRMADFECQMAAPSNSFYLKTNLAHQLPN